MRRKDKEVTNPEIIREILDNSEICRLGLIDDGTAYIVPVNYAHSQGILYIHSAQNGRKMEILKQNNHVSFEIELKNEIVKGPKACNWTAKYRSLMGKGRVFIETEETIKRKGLDLIMRKYGYPNAIIEYEKPTLDRVCILRLEIDSISAKQSGDW